MSMKLLNRALISAKARERFGLIALEGTRLINDALDAGAEPKAFYYSSKDILKKINLNDPPKDLQFHEIKWEKIRRLSDVETSTGLIAIFKKPSKNPIVKNPFPLTLICEQIRDPGNMGTLIRTATACGCREILCTKGCVDVWERKVLRAGTGAHFRIPITTRLDWPITFPTNSQIFIADCKSENCTDYKNVKIDYSKDIFIIISGEAHGISKGTLEIIEKFHAKRINIPCQMQSLNTTVAAGIILYELRSQICSHYNF